jgi:hypothetical protein
MMMIVATTITMHTISTWTTAGTSLPCDVRIETALLVEGSAASFVPRHDDDDHHVVDFWPSKKSHLASTAAAAAAALKGFVF